MAAKKCRRPEGPAAHHYEDKKTIVFIIMGPHPHFE